MDVFQSIKNQIKCCDKVDKEPMEDMAWGRVLQQ